MVGDERTYFTVQNCINPFFIINGMTDDVLCTDLLVLSDLHQELARHLRENGFDAVFFYDPHQVVKFYDTQSSFVFNQGRLPTEEEKKRFTSDPSFRQNTNNTETQTELEESYDGLFLDDYYVDNTVTEQNNEKESSSQSLYFPLRSDAYTLTDDVKNHLKDRLTSEDLRCAVVFYDLAMWQTKMDEIDLKILTELDRHRDKRQSIAIFLVPTNLGMDLENVLLTGANSQWITFANKHLLKGLQLTEDSQAVDFRLITLGPPGKGEIRNYLTMRRLSKKNPMNIDMTKLDEICSELAAKCSEKYISMSLLDRRIRDWLSSNIGSKLDLNSVSQLIGGAKYRTAQKELSDLAGIKDNPHLELFFRQKLAYQHLSEQDRIERLDKSRLTPRQVGQISSSYDLNLLIMGNPGTGKSLVAGLVGKLYREVGLLSRGHLRTLELAAFNRRNFDLNIEFQHAAGGVIVIEDAYQLPNAFLISLAECMSRYAGQLAVVLVGGKDHLLNLMAGNPGLNSRFPESGRIELSPYSPEDLQEIFLRMTHDRGNVRISESLRTVLPVFFNNWAEPEHETWRNAREVEHLLDMMIPVCGARQFRTDPEKIDEYVLTEDDLPDNLKQHAEPHAETLDQAVSEIRNMIGMANVKRFLMKIVEDVSLQGKENQVPGAYLFMGPPGTGKTMIAEKMARLLHLLGVIKRPHVVIRTARELLTPPAGQQIGNGLQSAANEARGGVLFIDEAHQLADEDTRNGLESGTGILKELVPIMDNVEFRTSTCLILAGYTGPMEQMLKKDEGFESRFPRNTRIRFTSYSAEELVKIMELFAQKKHEKLNEDFKNRSVVALSKYLMDAPADFGNARWIRNEYLPNACAKRNNRLFRRLGLEAYSIPEEEQLKKMISKEEIHTLTGEDIPDNEGLSSLAGPLNVAPPAPLTLEKMLDELFDKDEIRKFARQKVKPVEDQVFLDSLENTGINFSIAGPSGSGRKTAINTLAHFYAQAGLIDSKETRFLDSGDLTAGFVRQTASTTRKAIANGQGGVIIIVNPSGLIKGEDNGSQNNDFGLEAIQELGKCISEYSSNTAFVLLDTKAGLDLFFRTAPSFRNLIRNHFELEDLSIEAMQKIFMLKIENKYAFSDDIKIIINDFIANWVSDRGGLGDAFLNWNNGDEIESLIGKLKENWENDAERKTIINAAGYQVRLITKKMFPREVQKYLKATRLEEQAVMDKLDNMVGWNRVKYSINLIKTKIENSRKEDIVPGNYLFIGNPGTGKTEAARLMGSMLRSVHALKQGYVIVRTAAQMWEQLENFDKIITMARHNVLFIDEAHQLANSPRGQEVIKRLLTVFEDIEVKKNTCIILAGYIREMGNLLEVDPGLESRFGVEESRVYFDDYSADELLEIMKGMAEKANSIKEIEARCPINIEKSQDFVGKAAKVFQIMVARHDPNYGNARYVRNFLHNSVNQQVLRLAAKFGSGRIPEKEFAILSEDDIPEIEKSMIREKTEKAMIPAGLLTVDPDRALTIDRNNIARQVELIGRSVMLLEVTMPNKNIEFGTGFIITGAGYMLTCAHVVEGAEKVRARLYWPGLPRGNELWFDCKVLEPACRDIDMAILKIEGDGFIPLNLREAGNEPQNGEQIMIVGYPFGDISPDPKHFEGSICGVRLQGEDDQKWLIDCSGKSGNSGSPVLSMSDGRVVGVFDGSHVISSGKITEEINHFRPLRMFWKRFVYGG